jgi:hypothetical protein
MVISHAINPEQTLRQSASSLEAFGGQSILLNLLIADMNGIVGKAD